MKLLYVDVNVSYMNPTPNLAPILMQTVDRKTVFYGPGFVSVNEIEMGIEKWVAKTGPYDAVIFGAWSSILDPEKNRNISNEKVLPKQQRKINFLKRYCVKNFGINTSTIFFKDIEDNYKSLEITKKIFFGLAFDYYAFTQYQVDQVLENDLSLIAPNNQFCKRLEDLPEATKLEYAYKRKQEMLTNAWQDLVQRNPERIITATHFVSSDEFSYKALAERKNVISVPGVLYNLRKEGVDNLKKKGFSNNKYKRFATSYKIADRLGLKPYSRALTLKLFNFGFFQGLTNTKFVYTARGGFGTPIRKFFEIPAAGALLLCEPCFGYDELGFNDGIHYIRVEPDNLVDKLEEIVAKPELAQKIANSGRALIASKHSLSARAVQIRECIQAITEGTYKGACWDKGKFIIKTLGEHEKAN